MRSPRQLFSPKFALAFVTLLSVASARQQDPTSYLTPDVARVGARLACRCGTCRNTVGDCPMLHCSFCDPKRQQIYEMKKQGQTDDQIVSMIVQQEGIVALASPPTQGFGPILTWVMPGIALFIGFLVYSFYVKRNRKAPAALQPADEAVLERFRAQIDRELE